MQDRYRRLLPQSRVARASLAVSALLGLLGLGVLALVEGPRDSAAVLGTGQADVGGPFTLVDHTGKTVTDADYRGKLLLVFFGFTHCPDVCPTTLHEIAGALERLGAEAERVQPLFISVDPQRDTPEQLATYVAAFDPRIVGLTGTPEQVRAAAKAYRVYYAKQPLEGGDYVMNHSAFAFLMDGDGRYLEHFAFGSDAEAIAARIEVHL